MISAGRVGVRPDQVDGYGRIKITNEMVVEIKEKLNLLEMGKLMALAKNEVKTEQDGVKSEETAEVKSEETPEVKEDVEWQSVQEE